MRVGLRIEASSNTPHRCGRCLRYQLVAAEAGAGLEVGSWSQRGLATRDSLFPHVSGGLRGRTIKVTSIHVSCRAVNETSRKVSTR